MAQNNRKIAQLEAEKKELENSTLKVLLKEKREGLFGWEATVVCSVTERQNGLEDGSARAAITNRAMFGKLCWPATPRF
jgi:hypothetical protein